MKKVKEMKEGFNRRDFIGFILFLAIIGALCFAIYREAGTAAYVCLIILAVVILLFWLSPTITELIFISKKTKLSVKQEKKK